MKVIIFIGHHKVGSTALQDYLSRNARLLKSEGVLYPAVEEQGRARITSRLPLKDVAGLPLSMNVREPHNALAFRILSETTGTTVPPYHPDLPPSEEMLQILRRQIDTLAPHTVILASEVIGRLSPQPEQIRRVLAPFDGAEIHIVAVFRRIDDHLAAWFHQCLRFGFRMRRLRYGLHSYTPTIHFDYPKMLEGWLAEAGSATFHIWPYGEVMAAGGLVEALFDRLEMPRPRRARTPVRRNESAHRAVYELCRRGNHALDTADARELRQYLGRLSTQLPLPPSKSVELFGYHKRPTLLETFAPHDRTLAALAGRPVFFDDLDKVAELLPVAEMEAARPVLDAARAEGGPGLPAAVRAFLDTVELPDDGPAPKPATRHPRRRQARPETGGGRG